MITENELMIARIKMSTMSDTEFFASEITSWQGGEARDLMLVGSEYYRGKHDILNRTRTAIGRNGDVETVENLPNNIVVDNRYARVLDQKKNYLLGKPIVVRSDDESYYKELKKIFDASFIQNLKLAGEEALIGGISWLYPYIDSKSKLKFMVFPSYEICPFWRDSAHTELDYAARVYDIEVYEGKEKSTITKVDLFSADGITSYELDGDELVESEAIKAYITKGEQEYSWNRVPLIAIKSNSKEIPLIERVKQLQDALNLVMSDFCNNMEENVRNTILVLKNYDGTDLGEFRKNLSTFGVVKTRTYEGASGGVDMLNIEVNSENYKTISDMLIKAITQNARGYDVRDVKGSSNLNQLNIKSMYSDIDLDANDMEIELKVGFTELCEFAKMYLSAVGGMNFENSEAEIIFNRDILINETEAIENCILSKDILAEETIIAKHPWISDPLKEMDKIKNNYSI